MKVAEKLVPELRFPEFEDEWGIKKLKNISNIARGKFTPRPRNDPAYYGGDIPFVQTSDVVKSNGCIKTFTQTLNEKGLAVSKLFSKGTILITIAANIGYTGVLQIDMACPDSLIGIDCNENIFNMYINFYLSTKQRKMDYLAPEGAQKNINIDFLKPFKIPIPTLPEQQKIASFLSVIDKKIEKLTRKKKLLELYKKGVMQKIFSLEIRFKDDNGKDFSDWEEKRLGDVATFLKGKSLPKADLSIGGKLKCIRYGELYTTYSEIISKIKSATNVEVSKLFLSKINDVIIPSSGETNIDLATASYVSDDGIALGGDINVIRSKENGIFLAYYLNNAKRIDIAKLAQGISVMHLYASHLKNLNLKLPVLEEQQKIAKCLSTIDKKIESVQTQLTKIQIFKKGLLQKMLV